MKNVLRHVAASTLLAICICSDGFAGDTQPSTNLLDLAQMPEDAALDTRYPEAQILRIVDGLPETTAAFTPVDGEPVDLLFGFSVETIAPESLTITLSADASHRPPSRIDILGSSVSPVSGFSSLRTERVDPLKARQEIRFTSTAVKWLLIRLFPEEGAENVSVADLTLAGKEGLPETAYAFGETPAAALEIIGAMREIEGADLELTSEEAELFKLSASGNLNHEAFEAIALLASGVTNPVERAAYKDRIRALAADARGEIDFGASPAESGEKLLRWLHKSALHGGYKAHQTNLSGVLDDGVFNCVSSAVLYNAVASRLGLDVRAVEVPDHAFSIVYDDLDHMDVETTTPEGFNPRRERIAGFERLTGFRYIPQTNKSKRREIDAAGLAALIYYNHGVTHLREGRFQEALFANFRAMSLDPDFASAATNALAALGRWSTDLATAGEWEKATEIAAVGVRLAPKDKGLAATQKAIWQRWAFSEADAGQPKRALDILSRASREISDADFDRMRSAVITRPAERLIDAGNWAGALVATASAGDVLDPVALADLKSWRRSLYGRWAHSELSAGGFDRALEILANGLDEYPGDRELSRAVRYLAQQWARAGSYQQGLQALQSVKTAMPDVEGLDEVAMSFVQGYVKSKLKSSELDAAFADAQLAEPLLGADMAARLGAFVYEAYGHSLIEAQDWKRAAETYSEGRRKFPNSSILTQNARYVAQEWQRHANEEGGVAVLSRVQQILRDLFPQFALDPGFGEDEIVRQVNAALRSGAYARAEETLQSAQLLIRPKTYRNLRLLIFDRQAQKAMDTGDWSGAAAIYSDARSQMGEPSLFSNNVAYVAQEWTRAAASENGAQGVASALIVLVERFPGDDKVAKSGLRTLQRMVVNDVEADAFDRAEETIRTARLFLSRNDTQSLLVTLYTRAGNKAIKATDWPKALKAYADGLAILPDSRELSRNVPYVLQEWLRSALSEGGSRRLVAEIAAIRQILPNAKSLPDVAENVLGRELAARVANDDAQSALDLIGEIATELPNEVVADLKELIYDHWARRRMDVGKWEDAVSIYESGLADVPSSWLLENNRKFAASKL